LIGDWRSREFPIKHLASAVRPRLAEHDPAWSERFEVEAEALRRALGSVAVQIEHVGSTSIPGIAAKPTIDIAVGATTLDLPPEAVARLEELGYAFARDELRSWEQRYRRGAGVPWEVILHVVEWGGTHWNDFLRFRDALRADPSLAIEYEQLKRRMLAESEGWYGGVDKGPLVARVLAAAPARKYVVTASAEETEEIGARLAAHLVEGDVVTVSGELGSGKTTFVRGACRALGVEAPVTSPTFTIGHRYRGHVDVSHLDLFRFGGLSPAEWGDLEPYFDGAVVFVEWPEAGAGALPEARVAVRLEHAGGDRRAVSLTSAEGSLLEGLA
jgi:tRNA threonylcarbamoyladenosine biosynthesis protein TsaE